MNVLSYCYVANFGIICLFNKIKWNILIYSCQYSCHLANYSSNHRCMYSVWYWLYTHAKCPPPPHSNFFWYSLDQGLVSQQPKTKKRMMLLYVNIGFVFFLFSGLFGFCLLVCLFCLFVWLGFFLFVRGFFFGGGGGTKLHEKKTFLDIQDSSNLLCVCVLYVCVL